MTLGRLESSAVAVRLKRTENPAARYALLRARATLHYAARGHVVRRWIVRRYLKSTEVARLHIGAGRIMLPGWLNSDLISGEIYLDLGRKLPLPSSSFAYVFGEHVIEHLSERTGAALLSEVRRILLPGGVLRLTTPDLRKILALYEDRNPAVQLQTYARFLGGLTGRAYERPCQVLNDYLRLWGHRYVYDEEDLSAKLVGAGFVSVTRREPAESDHGQLRGLESHGGAEWVNRAEAMCLEATCPARAI
jgi:predicted SAM-dependent methyltransferase